MSFHDILDPITIIKTVGLLGVVLVIFAESGLFFGFFLPGDSLLFTAGILASKGYLPISALLVLCLIAAVLGDNVGYAFGKKTGPLLFSREDSRFFRKSYLEKTTAFYHKHGKKTIIFARFIPIVRTFAPILAGVAAMEYKVFFRYNLIGAVIWTWGILGLAYILGNVIPNIEKFLTPIIIIILVLSFVPAILEFFKHRKI